MNSLSSAPALHLNPQRISPPLYPQTTPLQPLASVQSAAITQQAPSSAAPAGGALANALADRHNLRTLGQQLNETAKNLGPQATPQAVRTALKTSTMQAHPASAFPPPGDSPLTLEAFITAYGLSLPTDHFSLVALADAVLDRAREHPLGNFGGSLSWPLELSVQAQRTVLASARDYAMRHPNPPRMGPSLGILEYLNSNQPLSAQAMDDPANALETLLSTPRAQAMGQALQTQLNGIATATSASDYVLAAINLVLDPQSLDAPAWNKVADFDLTQTEHWGKPASAIRDGLSAHLVEQGDATPAMAKVAAHLLLARKAPELLIKDIPASVTYGSPAWVSLSVAAATIEAQTPGKVPNMTFTQVMMEAESAGLQDLTVTQQAQSDALRVWGLVSGTLSAQEADRYGPADKQKVRSAFNAQANERLEASVQIDTEIPSRRAIALAKLKERFGEDVPFEEKLLTVKATTQPHDEPLYNPNRTPAGRHSLLDIAMSGLHAYQWESEDPRVIEATRGKSLAFDVNSVFNEQFAHAVDLRKKGIATTVKQLIARLPLEDRQTLEYAKLEFYQNPTYRLSTGFTGRTLERKNPKLLIKATSADGEKVYEIDLKQGAISRVRDTVLTQPRPRNGSLVYPIEPFTPAHVSQSALDLNKGVSTPLPIPASFSSARTQAIADVFVEHLDIDGEDAVKRAKGTTRHDQHVENEWKLADFFLDLVPLRSAIVNFRDGNYLEGTFDLGMDIFGFVTGAAGAASRVTKVAASAANTTRKAAKVAKILGTTVVSELNPLSGLGSLVEEGSRLIGNGVKRVRGASGGYELTKRVSAEHGPVTYGTFKIDDHVYEADTIVSNGQRYAYDPAKATPYGPPLEGFNPLDTLAPVHPPKHFHGHRNNLVGTDGRPVRPRKPLPSGDYVESMRGRLEADHFKPDTKAETVRRFNEQMAEYYEAIDQNGLPPRPAIPQVPKQVPASELLTETLKVSPGVVLGESHSQMASFRVLYDNVTTLKSAGVTKVYFEGLIDMPQGLMDDGIGLLGRSRQPRTHPTFEQLCKKLKAHGIEVLPLDHYYLTRHKDLRGVNLATTAGNGSTTRLREFNYYAAETIQANSGTEKWVALVGNAHMNTSEGIPGLAELTGSIGVGVSNNSHVKSQIGLKVKGHTPDPALPLRPEDTPGDLQIFVKP